MSKSRWVLYRKLPYIMTQPRIQGAPASTKVA
jgi:hypothetical protein